MKLKTHHSVLKYTEKDQNSHFTSFRKLILCISLVFFEMQYLLSLLFRLKSKHIHPVNLFNLSALSHLSIKIANFS